MKFECDQPRKLLRILLLVLLAYWALQHLTWIAGLVGTVLRVLSPLLLGVCFAFILNVPLRSIETAWSLTFKKGGVWADRLKRPICLAISLGIVLTLLCILLFLMLPELEKTITLLVEGLPTYLQRIEEWWNETATSHPIFDRLQTSLTIDWDKLTDSIVSRISQGSIDVVNTTVNFTTSLFNGVVNVILAVTFALYILSRKEKLGAQFLQIGHTYLPHRFVDRTKEVCALSNQIFSKFIIGQVTEAAILGVLCFIGMWLLRLPYALMISVLVGVTALIPVFGAFIGAGVGAFLIIMVDPLKALWFLIFLILLQQVEGNLIYPKVVGKSVGLPGIWVLAAVTIGGGAFGLIGILFAVPIASVLYYLLKEDLKEKESSKEMQSK